MPRGNLDWPARLERTDESFRSHPSPRPSPRWYVFSGRRSSPHGVLALAGRATEELGYWAWPETQPAKAGTPCIERRGHANHIQSGATAGRGGPFRPLHADGLVAARQAPPATN